MPSATKTATARGGDGAPLLKASELPKSKNEVTVFVHAVREAPEEWKSPLILDIDETYGAAALALNKTQVKALVTLIDDDYEKWAGYEVTLSKIRVTNPTTHQPTWGFEITAAKKSKRKPKVSEVPF